MKIVLEDRPKLVALGLGYYQFVEGDYFEPAAIGVTKDSVVIYSDYEPDEIQNDAFAFSVKKTIRLGDVKSVIVEKIVRHAELKRFMRLNIIMKDVELSTFFYFDKVDKKYMNKVIRELKYADIRVVKRTVDLRPIA